MINKKPKRIDIHQQVTDQIIDLLDKVSPDDYESPFARLGSRGLPVNPVTTNRYHGVNVLSLWFNQNSKFFTSNQWATFKQWKEKGAQVRKGEKGSRIIFYKTLVKSGENGKGEEENVKIPMLKTYTVFNANQVDGYEHLDKSLTLQTDKVERLNLVDKFCKSSGADIRHENNRAYYSSTHDYINMPKTSFFFDTAQASATENYYSTLLHELTHWTGAKHRLDRDKARGKAEIEKYAFEELVAELGAAFLCAQHGITQTQPDHHAIYIKGWLKAFKDDKTYIFKASARAAKATEFLNALQIGG